MKKDFADVLKELREQSGLTQRELAAKASLSLGGLRDLEQGRNKPSWETVQQLSKALGVDCKAFEAGNGKKPPKAKPGRPAKKKDK